MSSLVCLANDMKSFPIVYFKLIFSLIIMAGYLLLCSFCMLLYILKTKSKNYSFILIASGTFIFIIMQPDIVQ